MTKRLLLAIAVTLCAGACGSGAGVTVQAPDGYVVRDDAAGTIRIDGSSTVAPLMKIAGEDFQDLTRKKVTVTVGVSGTGGGFEKFCNRETDIANASRRIKDSESKKCAAAGVEFVELQVANDALSVVVNTRNDWVDCLSVAQLKKLWAPDGTAAKWSEVDPTFPNRTVRRFGPGTDSGTFDYFTEAVNGKVGVITRNYNPTEDDNVTITGVSGDLGGVGFLGLSYALESKGKVRAVAIDGGKGCVEPSALTVQDGTYKPLGRPLFAYVSKAALTRPEVDSFIEYYYAALHTIVEEALFIDLTPEQESAALSAAKSAGLRV